MKFLFSFLLIAVIAARAFSQETTSASCQLFSVLQIDGQSEDWPLTWMTDSEKEFSYNVCSDDKYLFVRVKTEEYHIKRKMAAFGFTLWIDPNGKKKRKLGLRFPVGGAEAEERVAEMRKSNDNYKNLSVSQRAEVQKEIDRKLIVGLEVLELIGLAEDPITATRSGITNGIKVAIGMDADGAYVYEAIIPFKSYRLSKASISDLGIGFETGKYTTHKAKTNTKTSADGDFSGARTLAERQGYESLQANPQIAYASSLWVTLKLK